jgi:hypothetical protein
MSDPQISKWRTRGDTFLWRYKERTKRFFGWHFTANTISCRCFLDLFKIMEGAIFSGTCRIKLQPPTQTILSVPNNRNGNARYEPAKELILKFDPLETGLWDLNFSAPIITLKIGKTYLGEFKKGIENILNGQGDYAIGPTENDCRLWFWWMV